MTQPAADPLPQTPRPSRATTALVLGVPVALGLLALTFRSPLRYRVFSNSRLIVGLISEMTLGALFAWYLFRRGWRWWQVTRPFGGRDIVRALAVWLLGYLAVVAVGLFVSVIDPAFAIENLARSFAGHPSVAMAVVVAVINPIIEESVWLGYAVNGPGGRRPAIAIGWSVVPRCLLHLYQGWGALLYVAPLGLWYLRYYMRTQRLWPVIVAHGMQDLVAIGFLAWRGAT